MASIIAHCKHSLMIRWLNRDLYDKLEDNGRTGAFEGYD